MVSLDVETVRERAAKALADNKNNPEESRNIFLEEIMDWTDYYTENYLNGSSKTNSAEAKRVLNCIIDLWIAFSAFEFSLKQYKKALQVYEDALNDTIVNSTSKIYISYAKYCVDRNKLATAQKIYIRALCNKLSRADNDILWDKFLELAHQVNKSEDLTLTDLYEAVTQQVPDASVLALPSHLGDVIESKDLSEPQKVDDSNGMEVVAPTETVVKEEVFDSTAVEKLVEVSTGHQQLAPIASKIVVMHAPPIPSVPPAHVTDSGGIVEDLDSFGPMTPEQVIRRFTVRPPMLFSAPFKEPMAKGVESLTDEERSLIENYFNLSLDEISQASESLDDRSPNLDLSNAKDKLDVTLDILEALWSSQALQERHFDSWMINLNNLQQKEEAELAESLNKMAATGSFSSATLQARMEAGMKLFRNRCAVQHELIFATINRTLYSLLLEQQDVLSRISFPMFSQEFNDSLSKYALTNKIMTHNNTNSKVPFDMNMEKVIKMQSQLACAVLSIRINAAIDTRNKLQHDYKLSRNVSMNSENSTEPATPTDSVDYYSQDAKKRRKKRRLSNQKVVDQIMNSSGQLVGNSRINPEADSESLPLLQKLASMIKSSKQ